MATHEKHYYDWSHVPPGQFTEKQLLKRHRRLRKGALPVGKITYIFDKPRCRPKHAEPVSPEGCQQIRNKLKLFGLDATDQWDLYCLDRAGQLATMNLYGLTDSEVITFLHRNGGHQAARVHGLGP